MWLALKKDIKIALKLLICFTVITGGLYPGAVTLFAQWFFPWEANGSLIERGGKKVGSALIGQSFSSSRYFWGRPSATTPYPYNGALSSGSNSGPTNPQFLMTVKERAMHLMKTGHHAHLIPVDLVTASGSGLDPDISPAGAMYQIQRVAKARHLQENVLMDFVVSQIQNRTLGILGEPRVNVLKLNLALDQHFGEPHHD